MTLVTQASPSEFRSIRDHTVTVARGVDQARQVVSLLRDSLHQSDEHALMGSMLFGTRLSGTIPHMVGHGKLTQWYVCI